MSQPMPTPIEMTVDQENIIVPPGHKARLVINVADLGGTALSLGLSAQGLPSGWMALTPATLHLAPGQKALAILDLRPPAETPTDSYPFTLLARAHDNPAIAVHRDLMLIVGDVPQVPQETHKPAEPVVAPIDVPPPEPIRREQPVQLTLSAPQQTGNRSARFTLLISNQGHIPLDIDLEAREPTGVCSLELHPSHLRLSPGGEGNVQLAVRSNVPLAAGETRHVYPFSVKAYPSGGAKPNVAEGSLVQTASTWWMKPAVWWAVTGVLATALLALLIGRLGPQLESSPPPTVMLATKTTTITPTLLPVVDRPTSAPASLVPTSSLTPTFTVTATPTPTQRPTATPVPSLTATPTPTRPPVLRFVARNQGCVKPGYGQQGAVKGQVFDRNGHVIVGAEVSVRIEDSLDATARTNSDGWYEWILTAGQTVRFQSINWPGHGRVTIQGVEVKTEAGCFNRVDFVQAP